MIRPRPRGRLGITLTEILISILIMGVGMVSLAALFPVGLLRLRNAARDARSTLTAESALAELPARRLLNAESFLFSWYTLRQTPIGTMVGPLEAELPAGGAFAFEGTPGLPFAYDPLFWANAHFFTFVDGADPSEMRPNNLGNPNVDPLSRFGYGINDAAGNQIVRTDPDGEPPSAHGLQRLSNFLPGIIPNSGYPFLYELPGGLPTARAVSEVFVSPDDIVYQQEGVPNPQQGVGSPVVPDLSTGEVMQDYEYSWMITAQLVAAGNYSVFDGAIVLFHKRPFGPEPTLTGDRVVEAVWGFSNTLDASGYGRGDDRTVLLRWPENRPDPNVPVGSWIADVTYERFHQLALSRFGNPNDPTDRFYPPQRCYWYQVTRRGMPEPDPDVAGHRRMLVRIDQPVRAKTRIGGHVNTALLNNYVVNVFPKVFYSK